MFCNYCDGYMELEYIDVEHEHQNQKKKYFSIPDINVIVVIKKFY